MSFSAVNKGAVAIAAAAFFVFAYGCKARPELAVTFNDRGLKKIVYGGAVLTDVTANPSDALAIGHMKCTSADGTVIAKPKFDWGENFDSRKWDAATRTMTYSYPWGAIEVQYIPHEDRLDISVTEKNSSISNIVLQGATIRPLTLHLPSLPSAFKDASYVQLAFNKKEPSVTVADYGSGEVVSVVPDSTRPLYSGFIPGQGAGSPWIPIISSTAPDNLASFYPKFDRPVRPGESDSFRVSLLFAPSGTKTTEIAGEVYEEWNRVRPALLAWPDRRVIGTVYLASAPPNEATKRPLNNPRRYFNEGDPRKIDVRDPDGLVLLQKRVLKQAQDVVSNLRKLNAQGVITWDIEGEEFPHSTSYVCAPDQIEEAAPEMESVIPENGSPYEGMKLDDAYFQIIRSAGFRVGVCVRPQRFSISPDREGQQTFLDGADVETELTHKIRFAHDRWGATLFYLDSTVNRFGQPLEAKIFGKVASEFPDSLLIPEESSTAAYAYTAGFQSFLFHSDTGTPDVVRSLYPKAFSAVLVNDVDRKRLDMFHQQLVDSVRRGDILMFHADYWQADNNSAESIYSAAGRASASH